jgi:DNA-binding NtrC family response regulator
MEDLGRVLVVSEDEHLVKRLEASLVEAGHRVVCFTDPWVALRFVKMEPAHVLVVDHSLLAMEARDFFARATKSCPNSLRILLTDFDQAQRPILDMHPCNIFRYLAKPCYEAMLLKAVGTALELLMLKASFRGHLSAERFEMQFPGNSITR